MLNKQFIYKVKDCMLKRPTKKESCNPHDLRVEKLEELEIISIDVGVWTIL